MGGAQALDAGLEALEAARFHRTRRLAGWGDAERMR